MKKNIVVFILCVFCIKPFFLQSQTSPLLITIKPLGILNTVKESAPSPVLLSFGIGAQLPFLSFMSFTPHAQVFATYYSWNEGQKEAIFSEVEQRTAYVPSILVDLPLSFDFYVKKSIFRLGTGLAFDIRFAILAKNIATSEKTSVDYINKWLWQKGRFLYPMLQFSWDYIFPNGMSVGIGIKGYIAARMAIEKKTLHGSMLFIGIRFSPAKKNKLSPSL